MYKTHTNDQSEVTNDLRRSEGARTGFPCDKRRGRVEEKRVRFYGCFGTKDRACDVDKSSRESVRLRTRRERGFETRGDKRTSCAKSESESKVQGHMNCAMFRE